VTEDEFFQKEEVVCPVYTLMRSGSALLELVFENVINYEQI
jgi:hypothetical protein